MQNNGLAGNFSNNNSYVNINETSIKRSHSISENVQIKKDEVKSKFNTNNVIVNSDSNNNIFNANISPNIQKTRKIPISKLKNTNYNSYTYEGNNKNGH